MIEKKIAVVGLGYVGLPLAVEFGKQYETVGFDIDATRICQLKLGDDQTREVERQDLLNSKGLQFTGDVEMLQSCDIFIVTVPTPIDSAKRPNLEPLVSASELVGRAISRGNLVIYESTVYPGCTEEVCVPILERVSGLIYNTEFFCGYSPERVNPGDKVNTLATIKKIISGSNDSVTDVIQDLYDSIIGAGTFRAGSIRVAEAAKVIENTQRDLNIALVNELSMIFHRLQIDTIDVLEAAGSKWNFLPFRPGLVGGHCIGVDPYYLTHKAQQLGYDPQVILAGRKINDEMACYAASIIVKKMIKSGIDLCGSQIGMLGVTFKENCPDIRNSKIFDLIAELEDWGATVSVFDPWADAAEVEATQGILVEEMTAGRLFDSLVVAVGHHEFRAMNAGSLRAMCRGEAPVLADLKSIFDQRALSNAGFVTFRL